MQLTVEFDREEDGRHIAEVLELSDCMAYDRTQMEADPKARTLALRILADQVEHGERDSSDISKLFFEAGNVNRWPAEKARRA
jgi:hypothetical protein